MEIVGIIQMISNYFRTKKENKYTYIKLKIK